MVNWIHWIITAKLMKYMIGGVHNKQQDWLSKEYSYGFPSPWACLGWQLVIGKDTYDPTVWHPTWELQMACTQREKSTTTISVMFSLVHVNTSETPDLPWAHWKGNWQLASDATSAWHSSLVSLSPNLIAPVKKKAKHVRVAELCGMGQDSASLLVDLPWQAWEFRKFLSVGGMEEGFTPPVICKYFLRE